MIKNDEELFDERTNYAMCISNNVYFSAYHEKKIIAELREELPIKDHFAEYSFTLELFVPEVDTAYFYRVSLTDTVFIKLNQDDKFELKSSDKDEFKLHVVKMGVDSIYDVADHDQLNDVYLCPIHTSSFSNFALNESFKELYGFMSKIDVNMAENILSDDMSDMIPEIKMAEDKTLLNKNILNSVKSKFQAELNVFIEKLQNKEFDYLDGKQGMVGAKELKGLSEAIQDAEIPYNKIVMHDGLQQSLSDNNTQNSKRHKL